MYRNVLVVMGTRPEVIKLVPVIFAMQSQPDRFKPIVCATGQHQELFNGAVQAFDLHLDYSLRIMNPNQTLAGLTSKAVKEVSKAISSSKPDIVLVQGDTTSAFSGSLAAYYQRIPVGHVEAGLRTGNKYSPFPEEINRKLIGSLADYHFAPTPSGKEALMAEGVSPKQIYITGNTVIDSLLMIRDRVRGNPPESIQWINTNFKGKRIVLVTGHRRESFGHGFESICQAIRELADRFEDVVFIYPVHLNPNVQDPVRRILGTHCRVKLLEPLDYEAFVWLMDRSHLVLTDSGGVQEEAPSLGKPVLVMRENSERSEGIESGNAILVGVSRKRIVNEVVRLLSSDEDYDKMSRIKNPYGDGKSGERIVKILSSLL